MVDTCVEYNPETYNTYAQSPVSHSYRYIVFDYRCKDVYSSKDEGAKGILAITGEDPVSGMEYSLYPKRKQLKRLTLELTTLQHIRSIVCT